jgi:hypothetical protein
MHHSIRRSAVGSLATSLVMLAACSGIEPVSPNMQPSSDASASRSLPPGTHLQYGTPAKLGEGMVRLYSILDQKADGAPIEIGYAIDASTMEGTLPGGPSIALMLEPAQQTPAPYDFGMMNWNPNGHVPIGVYDIPHFDFHFYFTPMSALDAIVPSNPSYRTAANNLPTGGEVPPFYFIAAPPPATPADIAVPGMGVHWNDVRSPELQKLLGNPSRWAAFTKTFIYGSWDGSMTFVEPMITRAYLLARQDVTTAIPTPAIVPETGWYPTAYRSYYDAEKREYRVAITSFVWRAI